MERASASTILRRKRKTLFLIPLLIILLGATLAPLGMPVSYAHFGYTISKVSGPFGVYGSIAYDSGVGELFVVDGYSSLVSVISDSSKAVIANISLGTAPYDMVYDSGKGEVFVSNQQAGTVSVINDSNNAVVATIQVGYYPEGLAYDSGKGEVFVANWGSGSVSVINDTTNTVVANVTGLSVDCVPLFGCANPSFVAYSSATGEIYVTEFSPFSGRTVSIISDANNTLVGTITVGQRPQGIAYDPDRKEMFVVNTYDRTVSIINVTSRTVKITIGPVGNSPTFLDYAPDKGEMFVANSDGSVSLINDTTLALDQIMSIADPQWGAADVAYDYETGDLYVTSLGVLVVSPSGPTVTTTSTTVTTTSIPPPETSTVTSTSTSTTTETSTITSTETSVSTTTETSTSTQTVTSPTTITETLTSTTTVTSTSISTSTQTVGGASITLNCSPDTVTLGRSVRCNAVATAGYPPAGNITFSNTAGSGTFATQSCSIRANTLTCTVAYRPSVAGIQQVNATYSGDPNFLSVSASTTINVKPAPAVSLPVWGGGNPVSEFFAYISRGIVATFASLTQVSLAGILSAAFIVAVSALLGAQRLRIIGGYGAEKNNDDKGGPR